MTPYRFEPVWATRHQQLSRQLSLCSSLFGGGHSSLIINCKSFCDSLWRSDAKLVIRLPVLFDFCNDSVSVALCVPTSSTLVHSQFCSPLHTLQSESHRNLLDPSEAPNRMIPLSVRPKGTIRGWLTSGRNHHCNWS